MNTEILSEALKLEISERIDIVEDIWDSIAEIPESIKLTNSQKDELDRRLDEYHKNPDSGKPWATVRSSLLSKNDK